MQSDPVTGPVWPRGWVEVQLYSSITAALEGSEWSAARPSRTLPPGKTRYPFYRRLGGTQGRSRRAEKLVPTGIRSRTVHPAVSRYTNWATRHTYRLVEYKFTSCHSFVNILKCTDLQTQACGTAGSQRMMMMTTWPTPTYLRTSTELCYTQCMLNGSNILNYPFMTTKQYRVLGKENYGIIIIIIIIPYIYIYIYMCVCVCVCVRARVFITFYKLNEI